MSEKPGLSSSAVGAAREVRAVIGRLRRKLLGASESEDLTLSQASALTRLAGKEGVTASDLAAAEGVRHQSMATTVASLAGKGLVERHPDPDDGRRTLITLTPEGHRRVAEGRHIREEWLATQLQEKCTEEERQAVIAAMAVLERLVRD
jgi:DNA-binding MarR family transcriptional regulator